MMAIMLRRRRASVYTRLMVSFRVDSTFAQRHGLLAAGALLAGVALAYGSPAWFLVAVLAASGACLLAAAFSKPSLAVAAWLLAVALTPDMWLGGTLGVGAEQLVGALKLAGLVLACVCVLRGGFYPDWFNPGLPFLAMFVASEIHGRLPALDLADSVRSLLGSMAPFAFSFAVLRPAWASDMLRAVRWLPLGVVAVGAVLDVAGLHPLFNEAGGARLAGAGHPAFLAGFALAAIYACLLELFRDGRRGQLGLLAANLLILLLTGARAPAAVGVGVTLVATIFVTSPAWPYRRRVPLLLGGGIVATLMTPLLSHLTAIRLFDVLDTNAGGLSGRDQIWPLFRAARDGSPWVGWGVGAGKELVPLDSLLAHLLGTTAAHNEYLRIGVDGGWLGLAMLMVWAGLWTWRHTRRLRSTDAAILRLAMLGSAIHAYTDNTLIATTASVMFAFMSAAFARREPEARPPAVQ